MRMECLGHQFFTTAGFTGNQDGNRRLRQAPNGSKHFLHGRRLTKNTHPAHGRHFGLFAAATLFDCPADQVNRVRQVERLGKILERTVLKSGHCAFQIGKSGHDDNRQRGVRLLDLLQHLNAINPWHSDV